MKRCMYCSPRVCRPWWLYVVTDRDCAGLVKVGISSQPTRRLAAHRKKEKRNLGVFYKTELRCEFDAIDAEDKALRMLAEFRSRGDWFDCLAETAMEAVKKASGNPKGR